MGRKLSEPPQVGCVDTVCMKWQAWRSAFRTEESRRAAAVSSTSSPFGQNEWLVEEMYRKFRDDPSSVDASWHDFLVDYNPEATGDTPAPPEAVPARSPAPSAPPATPAAVGNGEVSAPATPAKPAGPAPADGDEVQVLRGAAAAVVKNMSMSLDLPTATSVRAVPAKLMIDNRTVINNQLKRTRGGKISFTHLLGYALVQAVKKFPNMNRHYAAVVLRFGGRGFEHRRLRVDGVAVEGRRAME